VEGNRGPGNGEKESRQWVGGGQRGVGLGGVRW
jgi:hypothetical protein